MMPMEGARPPSNTPSPEGRCSRTHGCCMLVR
jgi:hypothetical protein